MNEEEIKLIANKIVEIEKMSQVSLEDLAQALTEIAQKLSFEDMILIDEYITKNNLLTK